MPGSLDRVNTVLLITIYVTNGALLTRMGISERSSRVNEDLKLRRHWAATNGRKHETGLSQRKDGLVDGEHPPRSSGERTTPRTRIEDQLTSPGPDHPCNDGERASQAPIELNTSQPVGYHRRNHQPKCGDQILVTS